MRGTGWGDHFFLLCPFWEITFSNRVSSLDNLHNGKFSGGRVDLYNRHGLTTSQVVHQVYSLQIYMTQTNRRIFMSAPRPPHPQK